MATATHRRTAEHSTREAGLESGARSPRRGAKRTVLHYIRQLPSFVRLLFGLIRDPRVAMLDKLLVFGAVAYIITPIDLIPDFIPFIGEVDDVYILVLALHTIYLVGLVTGALAVRDQMLVALAAYAAYVVNATQFLLKLRAARRNAQAEVGLAEPVR